MGIIKIKLPSFNHGGKAFKEANYSPKKRPSTKLTISIEEEQNTSSFPKKIKKKILSHLSFNCSSEVSTLSQTLLFLSVHEIQKMACKITRKTLNSAFLPKNLPKPKVDVSLCYTPPNEDPNNTTLHPKGF